MTGRVNRRGAPAARIACAAWVAGSLLACAAGTVPQAEVRVGTGQATFEAIPDGGAVELVCGSQGGQHVWVTVRVRVAAPTQASLEVALVVEGESASACARSFTGFDVEPGTPADEGWVELTGIACIVPDPSVVSGRAATLSATLTPVGGRVSVDSVRVVPFGPGRDCSHAGAPDAGSAPDAGDAADAGT